MPFHTIDHPLALHKLSYMRGNAAICSTRIFTSLMKEMGMILAVEVTKVLYKHVQFKTIIGINNIDLQSEFLVEKKPILIPILRGGLLLADGMQQVISTNYHGQIGIYHDEGTDKVIEYLSALPENELERFFILVDPIISTGLTSSRAINTLIDFGVASEKIVFVSLMVGTTGQERLNAEHPEVSVFAVKVGEEMVGKRLLRGLGSVSGRLFNTI